MIESALYPKVREQFPGIMVRVDSPSRPGISDLVLVGKMATIFAEIKIATLIREKLKITRHQMRFLQEVEKAGGLGCVLVWVREDSSWWLVNTPLVVAWWPSVRALQGIRLGTRMANIESMLIHSMSPQPGLPSGLGSSVGTGGGVSGVLPLSTLRVKLG